MGNFNKKWVIASLLSLNVMGLTATTPLKKSMPVFNNTEIQQTYHLTGKVVDKNGLPISNASVVIPKLNRGVATNSEGNFIFNNLPNGDYEIKISYVGKKTTSKKISINGQSESLHIALADASEQLSAVTLEGNSNKFSKKPTTQVSRLPLKNIENPQVYTTITSDLLDEQIITDFNDALTNAPGISNVATGPGGGGLTANFNLRGFSNASMMIRNGLPAGRMALRDFVNIDRIEVLKGPSGTLFGSGSIAGYGGIINVITKKPFEDFGGRISFTGGSYDYKRLTADVNTPLNNEKTLLFRTTAAYQKENSFQDMGGSLSTVSINPSFTYKASDRLTLDLDVSYYNSKRPSTLIQTSDLQDITNVAELNLDPKQAYVNEGFDSQFENYSVYAAATYKISDNWTSTTSYSNYQGDNTTHYMFLYPHNENEVRRFLYDIPVSTFSTVDFQENINGDFKITDNIRNRVVVGFDYYRDYNHTERGRATIDTINILDENTYRSGSSIIPWQSAYQSLNYNIFTTSKNSVYSAYASDVISFFDRLNVMLSLRYDHYVNHEEDNDKQDAYSPKFGLVYEVIPEQLSIFGNYMDGFTNNLGVDYQGNSLDPEHAHQFEAGLKFNLIHHKLDATISYYKINVEDATRTVNRVDIYQDVDKESEGVEIELVANPVKGLNIIAGYAYNDVEFSAGNEALIGNRPNGMPRNVANLWASYKFQQNSALHNLGFGFGGNAASKTYTNDANTVRVDGYVITNAAINYRINNMDLALKVNNIGNKHYYIANSGYINPQKPRTFLVNLTYNF